MQAMDEIMKIKKEARRRAKAKQAMFSASHSNLSDVLKHLHAIEEAFHRSHEKP